MKEKTSAIIMVTLILAFCGGWVSNAVRLCLPGPTTSKENIIRVTGVFVPPFGAVVGYISFDKPKSNHRRGR